jgi:hypothetical protein
MEHFVHIAGFDKPVRVTEEQERQIRSIITGAEVLQSYISLGDEKRTILAKTAAITALESRPKGEFSFTVARNT